MTLPQPDAPAPRRPGGEFAAYLTMLTAYFVAFGMQMILFPYLVANVLEVSASAVGVAQVALQIPMLVLLLWGGLIAERMEPRGYLIALHLVGIVPPAILAGLIALGWLSYPLMLVYGLAMGSFAAMALPARDAALNGVVMRDAAKGRHITLQKAVTLATAAQLGGQLAGMGLAGSASVVGVLPLIAVQCVAFGIASIAALGLARRTKTVARVARGLRGALSDIADGVRFALGHRVMLPMILIAGYVGVFVIGSFSVLFPLIVRDSYGMGAEGLSLAFVAFWSASFCSSVALSRLKPLERPGRALLASQFAGAIALASFAIEKPFAGFLAVIVAWGLAAGVALSMSRTITQQEAEPAYLARVLSVYSLGFMGGAPIGAGAMGLLSEAFGPRMAALFPAAGLAIAILWMAARTPIWTLTRKV